MDEDCVVSDTSFLFNGTGDGPCSVLADLKYWPTIKQQSYISGLEVFFVVLFFLLLVVGIIANSLTLAVFCQLRAKLLWANSNLLILLNLCVCDNVIVCVVAPFTFIVLISDRVYQGVLYEQEQDAGTTVLCNIVGILFNHCSKAILLFLAIGAVDRFIALFIPFKYKTLVTAPRVRAALAVSHLLSLLVTVVPFIAGTTYKLDHNYAACHYKIIEVVKPVCNATANGFGEECIVSINDKITNTLELGSSYFFIVLLMIIVPGLIMLVCSICVIYKLFSRIKEKEAERSGSAKEKGKLLKGDKKAKVDPQRQAALTITYLVMLYVACYLIWWVLSIETFLEFTGALGFNSLLSGASARFTHYFMLSLTLMTYVSSSLNPLIYFGRNRILMEKLEGMIKFKESVIVSKKTKVTPSFRRQISAPLSSIQTF